MRATFPVTTLGRMAAVLLMAAGVEQPAAKRITPSRGELPGYRPPALALR
jgi:hypothetical protein